MRLFRIALCALTVSISTVRAEDSMPEKPLNDIVFTQKRQMAEPSISPDGEHIAIQTVIKDKKYLLVGKRNGITFKYKAIIFIEEDKTLSRIRWISAKRLMYTLNYKSKLRGTGYRVPTSIMIAVNRDGSEMITLRTDGGKQNRKLKHLNNSDLIHMLPDDPDHILVGRSRNRNWIQSYERGELSDVYKINVHTSEMALVMRAPKLPKIKMTDWYADAKGNIRFGYGNTRKGKSVMAIRGKNDEDWKVLSDNELFAERKFSPLMFGKGENEFYVLSSLATGRNAVFRFDIATGQLVEKIFEHEEVDVNSIIYSQEKGKILSIVYYNADKQQHYMDKEYRIAQLTMEKSLKSKVEVVSKSKDEKYLIVRAYDDTDPGSYYFYDIAGKKMGYIGSPFPSLPSSELVSKKAITYQSRDGLTMNAYLTKPKWYKNGPTPTIILPNNNEDGRYYKTYHYMVQFLASRGYAVLQPNVRGSSGYGDRFQSLGEGEWGQDKQKDLQDAAYWLVDNGHAKDDQVCILGIGDYAGYEAIMSTIVSKDAFACAISWGGYTDIIGELKATRSWNTDSNYYYRIAGDLKKKEVKKISPIHRAAEVSIPLMVSHGEEDSWADVKFPQKFVKALKKQKKVYEYHEFKGAGRWFEVGKETQKFFKTLEDFLYKHNPTEAMKKWRASGQ